ncbi:MAG: multifunctional CCA addition/repair protein [Zoogloeaceae bacterium]|nr:multifunctional CCA addition/repair protein [Zoogloeaceae bacterium]
MQIYLVGGAVRDELLGRPVTDRDYVVVGSTPEELLAQGFTPVGRDFPVFLHPETHEEYALARTERKTGRGYHGFLFHAAPDVPLEADLARRDLTINAMAKDAAGKLIDPFHGKADLEARVLRHVGPAFAEDPVRILRLARFSARYGNFSIAPETQALLAEMVAAGEVDALVPERVWQEIARGLMEAFPARMFEVLRECGALQRLLPEIDTLFAVPERTDYHPEGNTGQHVLLVLTAAARLGFALPIRFAALLHDLGKGTTLPEEWPRHHGHEERGVPLASAVCARLGVPAECRDLALCMVREHTLIHRAHALTPQTMTELLERCDVKRRPERFTALLAACEADHRGRLGRFDVPYPQAALWQRVATAFRAVDGGRIARACATPEKIPKHLHAARVTAVAKAMANTQNPPPCTVPSPV